MKKLGCFFVLACVLSACTSVTPAQRQTADWGKLTSTASVAKVNNIKSLIQPGFY